MYKRFEFEGDVHQTLECVPLTVRRKTLTRAERLALCHLPVDSDEDREVYIEVMRTFCDRAGVSLKPLVDADASGRTWNVSTTPARVKERADALHARLDDTAWRHLDEESRYALVKLSDPKRNPLKLHAALVELGLLTGPAPSVNPEVAVCVVPTP
jgi:hypothetical protein